MTDREKFEEWYAVNAFDYVSSPIGSRECDLQWKAWEAATIAERVWVLDAIREVQDAICALKEQP